MEQNPANVVDLGSSSPLSILDGDDSSTTAPPSRLLDHPFDAAGSDESASGFKKSVSAGPGAASGANNDSLSAAVKKPRARKKKDDSSGPAQDGEVKPQRKITRKPRDPNAPPAKRQKKSVESSANDPQQKKLGFGLTGTASLPGNIDVQKADAQSSPAPPVIQIGNNETEQKPFVVRAQHNTIQDQSRPQSSGQRYDPIRQASAENARLARSPSAHARASPSIASLIDPTHSSATPNHIVTSAPRQGDLTNASTPTKAKPTNQSQLATETSANGTTLNPNVAVGEASSFKALSNGKPPSASGASSPKPARKKKEITQLPPGNGLLSGSDFGKPNSNEDVFAEVPNQCIVIEVPITGQTNNYVNFMKEVEAKYGFDVAHPRLAEHRRRMAQMAAAGAALESGAVSADDMALDGSDVDSNPDIGAADEESSAGDGVKKKRKTRGDEYDKNDDFIDDTEQAWEEQALASRDGYFVWSGPLVPEGDKPSAEKADGPAKRGRGGRGGRGGAAGRGEGATRGRGTGAKRGTQAGAGGGGRGSRGGGGAPTRKARITKAEKEQMEQEKAARLKLANSMTKPVVHQGIIGV